MPPILDEFAPAAPDTIDGATLAGEKPAIEHRIAGPAGKGRMLRIEADKIGRGARPQAAGAGRQGLGAAGKGPIEQIRARWSGRAPRPAHCGPGAVSRWAYSRPRSSAAGSIRMFESVPMPKAPPAAR